jgi:hypothetical protein
MMIIRQPSKMGSEYWFSGLIRKIPTKKLIKMANPPSLGIID